MRHPAVVALVLVGSLFAALSVTCLWLTIDILDADRFAEKVTSAFEAEDVRVAIASGVVDKVLEDRPLVARLVRDRVIEFLAPLLEHPMFQDIVANTVTNAHNLLLTAEERPLVLDFAALRPVVTALVSIVDAEAAAQLSERMTEAEESITLFTSTELPQIRRWASIPPWLWPVALVGALVSFGIAVVKAADRRRAVQWTGYGLALAGGLLLLFLPAVQSTVTGGIAGPGARALVDEAMTILLTDLQVLAVGLAGIGGLVWLAGRAVPRQDAKQA
jgi:hypothetical protein